MELHELTDDLTVGSQVHPAAMPIIAVKGFRAIVCNRPDWEAPGQPSYRSVGQAAQLQGIRTVYMPVPWTDISDADAAAFGKLVEELPKPVLAYCRSGSRCVMLWGLHEAAKRPFKEIVLQAMGAGYDLTGLVPRFQKLYRQ